MISPATRRWAQAPEPRRCTHAPVQLDRRRDHLTRLRLLQSRDRLGALLQEAAAQDLSSTDCLEPVLGDDVASKAETTSTRRTSLARVPFVKSVARVDVTDQPSLDQRPIQPVATCHVIAHGETLVSLGPPGVGNSHLAIGGGLNAIAQGSRVLFATAAPRPWQRIGWRIR